MLTRTFLTWDLVGSTRSWESAPDTARAAVDRSTDGARSAIEGHAGRLFKLTGDGGWGEFESASAALDAAVELQMSMLDAAIESAPPCTPVRPNRLAVTGWESR